MGALKVPTMGTGRELVTFAMEAEAPTEKNLLTHAELGFLLSLCMYVTNPACHVLRERLVILLRCLIMHAGDASLLSVVARFECDFVCVCSPTVLR